jgi:para-aminobenzoate synthetase/4-amino-4-deoxychorismate lyase
VRSRRDDDPLNGLPLAWFGLFAEARQVEPLRPARQPQASVPRWCWAIDETEYRQMVAAIRERIANGWTYQANFTTRLGSWEPLDPLALYAQLGAAQGGAYHGYVETDEWAVACASPELFFIRDGDTVIARPMKGTTVRGRLPAEDVVRRDAMLASPKERAENVIVVDLVRNDLGRIAEVGSVEVPALFVAEAFPGVWQMTSSVTAKVSSSAPLADLFAALFPSGSVTGAPKPATMALLAHIEERPRGVYCGAVGYVAPPTHRPQARFAVAIRTVTTNRRSGYSEFGVGSGVTWDSDPAGEWAELAAKARILDPPRQVAGGLRDAAPRGWRSAAVID